MKKINLKFITIISIIFFIFLILINSTIAYESRELNNGMYETIGIPVEEIGCMEACTTIDCNVDDMECREASSEKCMEECNIMGGATNLENMGEGEICMEECTSQGCKSYDFDCKNNNMEKCEIECNMMGDAPSLEDMDEEEICIMECIDKIDPTIICGASQEGETGNEACQQCANQCVHLYAGPCLNDEQVKQKERECETCEHCYGSPVMGPSGQGWDCIVDMECKDASAEFGDDPGTGPDSWEAGHAPSPDNVYWWDYEASLDIAESKTTFLIENNYGLETIKIDINTNKEISIKQNEERLIIKKNNIEIEVDNNIDKILISENGNKRDIENINIDIEEDKAIYKYEETKKAKLLGLIPIKKRVQKKVNAEKMETIEEKEPWWGALTTEEKEKIRKSPKDFVGESNPQPSPSPPDLVGESNPQPSPSPQDLVGESNPQPSP